MWFLHIFIVSLALWDVLKVILRQPELFNFLLEIIVILRPNLCTAIDFAPKRDRATRKLFGFSLNALEPALALLKDNDAKNTPIQSTIVKFL